MIGIAAQVSLYPLRSAHLSPAIERALDVFRKQGLNVQPGSMSTVISGENDEVFAALREAFEVVSAEGEEIVMVVTVSNACPVPVRAEG